MRHWVFLIVSGIFEVAWVVSLKFTDGFSRFLPTLFYALSGLGAAFFLSLSFKAIPMGTAYAIWMGMSVVGALAVDAALLKQPYDGLRIVSVLLILAGTCGLRLTTPR